MIRAEGYQGCESTVRHAIAALKQANDRPEVFVPLEFDPGQDAQVDWGEAWADLAGRRQKVQVFLMRLCYSRRTFAMVFPTQKQESFLWGHVQAFRHFGGVPHRISYDNLGTEVLLTFEKTGKAGRPRREVQAFVAFRSHYLFESHFCTVGEGHEKGQVESSVGYTRRNAMVPLPEAIDYADLNRQLLERCLQEDHRRVSREATTIGEAWEHERSHLLPLPPSDYECCELKVVHLTPYSQATYETNRYSVPVNRARREVTLKAYPFTVEIWDGMHLLARHPRCYEREQDIFDPLHYLPLLEQRPGAFDYAKPLKAWRKGWPPAYHQMLAQLRMTWPDGRGVQEFVRILQLHQTYTPEQMQQAIGQALQLGCIHLDGVLYCLRQITGSPASPAPTPIPNLDLSHRPDLDAIGKQPIDLSRYDRLLKQSQVGKARYRHAVTPDPTQGARPSSVAGSLFESPQPADVSGTDTLAYAKDAMRSGQAPERFLLALCEAETGYREAQRIEHAIKSAKLPFLKELSTYDFSAVESIQKTRVLELAQGGYMDRAENLLLLGAPGLGKTHLAIGLALCACRQGKRVRFYRAAKLVDELLVQQHNLSLSRFTAKFERLDLLVLDELGFFPVAEVGAQLLFQLCSDLYERVSMIVTSNLRFREWNQIFGEEKLTAAFIDRLTHKGHILEFVGESYRYRHRLGLPDAGNGEKRSETG